MNIKDLIHGHSVETDELGVYFMGTLPINSLYESM
jgi:hypothetical protein